MPKRFPLTLAVAASLLSLVSTKLSAQQSTPHAVQNGEKPAKKRAKPLTLQAALPTAEKAFAKEGVDADKYMLSQAIYLGDVRVFGSGDTRAPALQGMFQFALLNHVKLPAWVFT
ncbi:MAG: hypothetical protein ACKO2G_08020 [Verrucomicrobiales bacterium]